MPKAKDRFKKRLIVNISVIAGSFVVAAAAIYFLGVDIQKLSLQIAEGRDVVAERSQKINIIGSLRQQAPEARERKDILERLLPREEELLAVSQYLDGVGRTTNVDISFSFKGNPTAPTDSQPGYIDINIGARGGLGQIRNFLSNLEFSSTRFLIEIESVSIRAVEPSYRADITGRVFFRALNNEDST